LLERYVRRIIEFPYRQREEEVRRGLELRLGTFKMAGCALFI
jgi:hypothetical protein